MLLQFHAVWFNKVLIQSAWAGTFLNNRTMPYCQMNHELPSWRHQLFPWAPWPPLQMPAWPVQFPWVPGALGDPHSLTLHPLGLPSPPSARLLSWPGPPGRVMKGRNWRSREVSGFTGKRAEHCWGRTNKHTHKQIQMWTEGMKKAGSAS